MNEIDQLSEKVLKVLEHKKEAKKLQNEKDKAVRLKELREIAKSFPKTLSFDLDEFKSVIHGWINNTNDETKDYFEKKFDKLNASYNNLVKLIDETNLVVKNTKDKVKEKVIKNSEDYKNRLDKTKERVEKNYQEVLECLSNLDQSSLKKLKSLEDRMGVALNKVVEGLKEYIEKKEVTPHTIVSHMDTNARGFQLNRLTAGNERDYVDDLHAHNPELILVEVQKLITAQLAAMPISSGVNFKVGEVGKHGYDQINTIEFRDATVTRKSGGRVLVDTVPDYIQTGVFGEIYVKNGSVAQSIPNGTTYTKLTGFTTNGLSSGCTPVVASDKITLDKVGKYLVICSINAASATVATFKFAAFLNGVEQGNIHSHRKYGNANDNGSSSMSGLLNVPTAGLDLDVRARHDQAGAINWTPSYMNLSVLYIGNG